MLQIGDIVRFYDYDRANGMIRNEDVTEDNWRIGIVTEIRHDPWDEDWGEECCPYPVVYNDCHVQPIVMPNEYNIGTWVEVICESR